MKTKYPIQAIVISLLLPLYGNATSLTEALVHTYNNNAQLASYREQLKNKDEEMFQAISGFLPNASYSNINNTTKANAASNFGESDTGWRTTKTRTNQLQLSQNLFSGGGTVALVNATKYLVLSGRAELKQVEQSVLLDAVKDYAGVFYAMKSLEINKKNVEAFTKRLEGTQDKFKLGFATNADIADAQYQVSNAIFNKEAAENNLAKFKAAYVNDVGLEPVSLIEPVISEGILPKDQAIATNIALKNNAKVLQALNTKISNDYAIKVNIAKLLPTVDLLGSISNKKLRSNASLLNKKEEFKAVQVNITVPLYDAGKSYSNIRRAKNTLSASKLNLINAQQTAREEVVQAWSTYLTANSQLVAAKESVRSANISLDGRIQEYNEGVSSLNDLLRAQNELFVAENSLVNAEKSRIESVYNLLGAMGNLDAKSLNLPTPIYNPDKHYEKTKFHLIGF
jgi:outer membrane protein